MIWYNKTQFALFRIILGTYLTIHFAQLIPYGAELFSNQGAVPDASLLLSYGLFPNILFVFDHPIHVELFLSLLMITSVVFTLGFWRHRCSLFLFYGWACLLNRNHFISNPGLAYIGWLLLACSLIPHGERVGFWLKFEQLAVERNSKNNSGEPWQVTNVLYFGSWLIMAISYTVSGLHKLQQSDSWMDGTALHHVLTGALARHDNYFVYIILYILPPIFVKFMTWASLLGELLFLPFGCFYHTRKWYWLFMIGLHAGILLTVNFSDLTIGMLMIHLFTFDASWFEWSIRLVNQFDLLNRMDKSEYIHPNDFINPQFHSQPPYQLLKDVIQKNVPAASSNLRKSNQDETSPESNHFSPKTWILYFMLLLCGVIAGTILFNHNSNSDNKYQARIVLRNIQDSLIRFSQLTLEMSWGFGIIVVGLGVIMILERLYPDQTLKPVKGWWKWIIGINLFQLFAVVLATFTWESWLQKTDYFTSTVGFHLRDHVTPLVGGFIAYVVNQYVFFWWHFSRHQIDFFWITNHQFHHSPTRIEVIVSFFKHPVEIVLDSQIMAILVYCVLGLTPDSSMWLSIFSAFGEFFYHMNIKTPQWIGYFFQRPSSHRIHHYQNKQYDASNFSDFPLWDILGGTFANPSTFDLPTGFTHSVELKRWDMMMFKNVLRPNNKPLTTQQKWNMARKFASYCLVIWGSLASFGFLVHTDVFRAVGFASVASPLPLVFSSFRGVETFATEFKLNAQLVNGTDWASALDPQLYSQLRGPYNRKNIYGVQFSHGPFFDHPNMIRMRDHVLYYGICNPGPIVREFGLNKNVQQLEIVIRSKSKQNENQSWKLTVDCLMNRVSVSQSV